MNIPQIPRVSSEQYENMIDEQKRVYLLQIKQEETMSWQLLYVKIHVYGFWILLILGIIGIFSQLG
jgi:hypothetical protein